MLERLRTRKERHRERSALYRIALAVLGLAVVLAGIAMLVLPGPGLLAIAVGLSMLALEFAWAERFLEQILHRMERAKQSATDASGVQQVLLAVVALSGIAALIAAAVLWELPLVPF